MIQTRFLALATSFFICINTQAMDQGSERSFSKEILETVTDCARSVPNKSVLQAIGDISEYVTTTSPELNFLLLKIGPPPYAEENDIYYVPNFFKTMHASCFKDRELGSKIHPDRELTPTDIEILNKLIEEEADVDIQSLDDGCKPPDSMQALMYDFFKKVKEKKLQYNSTFSEYLNILKR